MEIRPVSFFSKKLSEADRHRSICEIELISLVNMICRFRHFLFNEFDIRTDLRALSWILKKPQRMLKYDPSIEQHTHLCFKVKDIRSNENHMADFLSKVFDPFEFDVIESKVGSGLLGRNLAMVYIWKIPRICDPIRDHQRNDTELSNIMMDLESGTIVNEYCLERDILLRKKGL